LGQIIKIVKITQNNPAQNKNRPVREPIVERSGKSKEAVVAIWKEPLRKAPNSTLKPELFNIGWAMPKPIMSKHFTRF